MEKEMKCIECDDLGYFTDVISQGLQEDHPYLNPHIERCDTCKKFNNDMEATNEANKK
jgi:hypothetical protein